MSNKVNHFESKWELKTRVSNYLFEGESFVKTDFNSAIFDSVSFINCTFNSSVLSGSKIFHESYFDRCTFINVDLSNTTFASNEGVYRGCTFTKCNFKGKEFNFTRFVECNFENCKLSKVNFNAATFSKCKFTGKLSDVTFNGMYDTNKSNSKILDFVDFSDAQFGEFVTFVDCDLSTVIPPKGEILNNMLYKLYSNNPKILSTGSKDKIVINT